MPDKNSYLKYKRDTNRLIFWLIHTAKKIYSTSKAQQHVEISTPELTLAGILSLSKLIAGSGAVSVPPTIHSLFESVIQARTAAYSFFQNIITVKPDPEVLESNRRHKAFIDTLTEAFHELGGGNRTQNLGDDMSDEEDNISFVNKYACLVSEPSREEGEEGDEGGEVAEDLELKENTAPSGSKYVKKGKKGKKGKGKRKVGKTPSQQAPEPKFEDLPLESYKIVDEKSTITDYLLAVYSIVREMADLRLYTQGVWQRVCHGTLNSAAAGAMCNMAVATIKQLQFEISSDFPGNGSFDAILNAITRGDPDTAQGQFRVGLWAVSPDGEMIPEKQLTAVDVKECFMVHAYRDMVAFIEDFRKNRTGHPTKAMLAKLKWDPNLDMKTASLKKRNEWRSAYTINWLYDLVLLWSSIVLQRKNGATTGKPEHFILENVDWSPEGKWGEHRRLWGPLEFAGDITTLAMSKESTDIKARLLPHHVFQMQCMVDSFMVSRGWSYYVLKGHVCSSPAKNYDPLLDIKHFLDRPNRGINYSLDMLLTIANYEASKRPDLDKRKEGFLDLLPLIRDELNAWLGTSQLAYGLKMLPPSRFANTNTNGLWVYSPYLCGTGLAEALEFIYNYGMVLWDRHPEPFALLHLYNMLQQTGSMPVSIDVLDQCIDLFGKSVFAGGKPPKNNFFQCWCSTLGIVDALGWTVTRRTPPKSTIGTVLNSKDAIASVPKKMFKQRSLLSLLTATKWRPEKIMPTDISVFSVLAFMASFANERKKKRSGNSRGKNSKININNQSPSNIVQPLSSNALPFDDGRPQSAEMTPELTARMKQMMGIPDDYTMGAPEKHKNVYNNDTPYEQSNRAYLELVERDVVNDIYGNVRPMSAISYIHLLAYFKMVLSKIEDEGKHFEVIREATSGIFKEPRVAYVPMILQEMDPKMLTFLGQQLASGSQNLGLGEFSYFPRFVDILETGEHDPFNRFSPLKYDAGSDEPHEQCLVM